MSSIYSAVSFFDRKAFVFKQPRCGGILSSLLGHKRTLFDRLSTFLRSCGRHYTVADPFSAFLQRWSAPDPFLPRTLVRGPRRWIQASFDWLCAEAAFLLQLGPAHCH